jgi:hypothetical protein
MAPKTKRRRSRQVDITPSVEALNSKRNSEMSALQCFAEFFDNAIDAGARNIHASVDADSKVACITDDGNGMASAAAALVSGKHVRSGAEHGSSRYGVGMKDAGWRLGPCLVVDSIKDGVRTRSVADAEAIMRRGKWAVTERSGKASDKPNGTKITVTKFDFQWSSNSPSLLRTGLEKLYADALRDGINMTFNDVELVAPPVPRLRVERTAELEVDGKRFRVRGGILAAGQEAVSNGVTIRLPYRVICWGERAGFDGYDVSDFWAEVMLLEEKDDRSTWFRVTDHKNSLHEKTAICRLVAKQFEDVLKPQSSSHVITIPLPRSPKKDEEGLIMDESGNVPVNDEPGDVGPQHDDEAGGGGSGGQPQGVAETDENGNKRAAPKKKRGYDLNIRMSPAKSETVAECRVGDKSATVVLGQQGNVFRGYTPGRDNGALRDAVALFAVASGLVLRHEDDPKTPLDFLIDGSDKPMDRLLRTYDNLLTQWKPIKK